MLKTLLAGTLSLSLFAAGCDGDDIDSDTEARWAYLGFDRAVDRALNLGFDGFNSASSANIAPQAGIGEIAGDMTVTGQVDQGTSANKEMRLYVDVLDYEDGPFDDPNTEDDVEELVVIYNTDAEVGLPYLQLSLRNVPDGDFTGSLTGTFFVSGEVEGEATFSLSLSGGIQEDPDNPGIVVREPGTLAITGTVTSGDGLYTVDVLK
jgi:hypothetical protein